MKSLPFGEVRIENGITTINAKEVQLLPGMEIATGAELIITTKK